MADANAKRKKDEEDPEYVTEEYYDEGPDYFKLVKQYTLTYVALFIGLISYACIGAAIFKALEAPEEYRLYEVKYKDYVDKRNTFLGRMWNATVLLGDDEEAWKSRALKLLTRHEKLTDSYIEPPYLREAQWSFTGALFFSCTVISTIGYGNIAPVTIGGRVFCMIYAVFGIALLLLVLASIGSLFARGATTTYRLLNMNIQMAKGAPPPTKQKLTRQVRVQTPGEGAEGISLMEKQNGSKEPAPSMDEVIRDIWSNEPEIDQGDMPPMRVMTTKGKSGDEAGPSAGKRGETVTSSADDEAGNDVDIPLSIVLIFALAYVCMLAGMLSLWEDQWNYFEAFYFSFVTLTTIGFGDLVPLHQKNLLGCTFFILLGMAIMSMCIALAQDIIMKKVAWISEKVGVALIKAKPT